MSNEDTKTKTENKAPTHRAYSVQLEAFPVNGRLTIRPIKEKSENDS